VYIGNYYEWTGNTSTMKSYYYHGSTRVAVHDGNGTGTTGLSWLFADHLGSTSLTTNDSGTKTAEVRYKAWGEDRYTSGTIPTTMKYMGQREESLLGLYFYNARWYDPVLGRFIQADTLVPEPGNPLAWDRYAYVMNNPVRYSDPSGHRTCEGPDLECDDPPRGYHIYPKILEVWKLKLEAMAVYAESSNGSFPAGSMRYTALWFLNRLTSGDWDQYPIPIWASLMGRQSALSVLYSEEHFPLPDSYYKNKSKWVSEQDLINWVNDSWNKSMNGSFVAGYEVALNATQKAYDVMWGTIDVNIIYFSHQTKSVDHATPQERWQWIRDTAALRTDQDPDFSFNSYGPFWSYIQSQYILLIGSNDLLCGTEGSCGPPWPLETP
jgi:RHS repeat-associated protein